MIKKIFGLVKINLILVCLFILLSGCSMNSNNFVGQSDSYGDRVARKAGRGVSNIFSAPLEIPNQAIDMADEFDSPASQAAGYVGGVFKGIFYGVGRITSGAYDIVTSPFSGPASPTMNPEFIHSGFFERVEDHNNAFSDVTGDEFGN